MNSKRLEIIEILGGFLCVHCNKVTDPRILERESTPKIIEKNIPRNNINNMEWYR